VKCILQYSLIGSEYELHRDEYLYLDQANHLAWGYLSVPPVTSWIAWLIKMLGGSVFWVKFFPALFGALTIVMVWKTIEELKGNLFARILGSAGILLSFLLRLNMLFQPTSLEVLCWMGLCFTFIKYINTEKAKWLYAGAFILGIGILNKYNIVFLFFGLLSGIAFTKQRRIFLQPHWYGAGCTVVLIVLPNLLWQYNNGFPMIHHMKELSETQLINVDRFDFLKAQLFFFIGSLFIIIAGLYALVFYKPFQKFRFFFWAYVFTIALFLFFRAKDYYAIGLYPTYIAFGSVFLSAVFENGWKKKLKPFSILIPILLFLPVYDIAFPNKSPDFIVKHQDKYKKYRQLRWEDGKNHSLPQDYADMQGWKELAQKVDEIYSQFPAGEKTLVLCDNYGQAGAINYYSKKGIHAVSFNADYINWFPLNEKYINLIRIKNKSENDEEMKKTSPYFQYSKIMDSVTNRFARERGTTIFSFKGAKIDINTRIKKEIDEIKKDD
jgi:hypothetical protein